MRKLGWRQLRSGSEKEGDSERERGKIKRERTTKDNKVVRASEIETARESKNENNRETMARE